MYACGLDLIESGKVSLPDKKGGLITNISAVSVKNNYSFDIIPSKFNIIKIFSPEHGLFGVEEAGAPVGNSEYRDIPVVSLYGDKKAPSPADLENIDYLVFDIQDAGLRFFTYLYTLIFCMSAAAEAGIPFYLLDRPDPLNGIDAEGNILNEEFKSFIGMYPIPQRHALTIGEFAGFIKSREKIDVDLRVIPLENWSRTRYMDEYGGNFNHASPNLPAFESLLNYAAISIFEGTNISEGRGTTMPFLLFGSPWIEEDRLMNVLQRENFNGVSWKKIQFKPVNSKYKGEICRGVRMFVIDRSLYTPVYTGLRLIQILKEMYPEEFGWLPPFKEGQKPFIEYLTGGNFIYRRMEKEELKDILTRDIPSYLETIRDFRLYE